MGTDAEILLGVNIDHVATIRNARGGHHPDPVRAAHIAINAGADGITAHLREDRRHISDHDIARLKSELTRPLNFEMAATDEMLAISLTHVPHACCLVPERREERTTEGGLDVVSGANRLESFITPDTMDLVESVERKAKLVYLDPRFTVTASKADAYLGVKSGTDTALALGIMHVLKEASGLVDKQDIVLVPDIYFVRDSDQERGSICSGNLVERVRQNGGDALYLPSHDEILEHLLANVRVEPAWRRRNHQVLRADDVAW